MEDEILSKELASIRTLLSESALLRTKKLSTKEEAKKAKTASKVNPYDNVALKKKAAAQKKKKELLDTKRANQPGRFGQKRGEPFDLDVFMNFIVNNPAPQNS